MAIIPVELLREIWTPTPVKGANQEFARFLNRSWGLLADGTPLGVIRGITNDPEEYDPFDHPSVHGMHPDFINYSRFVQKDLADQNQREIIIKVLDDLESFGWPRETHTDSFLLGIGDLRRPLVHLDPMNLLHKNTARFLETAVKRLRIP